MTYSIEHNLNLIRQVFREQGVDWKPPCWTTEGIINRGQAGKHPGLYWIYPEVNFYFGKAVTNTIYSRHQTHRAKLDVNLAALYSTLVEKRQPKWSFPAGWKQAVRKFIIEDTGPIPDHYQKTDRGTVVPGVINFPVTHRVCVDNLPVAIWDLSMLPGQTISDLEDQIIDTIQPEANAIKARHAGDRPDQA